MSNYMGAQAKSTNRTKYDLGRVHGVISVIMRLCTFYVTITRNEDKLCYFFNSPNMYYKDFKDNSSALEYAYAPKLWPHMKHINVIYHHLLSYLRDKIISIFPIDKLNEIADIFTNLLLKKENLSSKETLKWQSWIQSGIHTNQCSHVCSVCKVVCDLVTMKWMSARYQDQSKHY